MPNVATSLESRTTTCNFRCLVSFPQAKKLALTNSERKGLQSKRNGSKCLNVKGRCCGIFKDLFTRDRFLISTIHASGRSETNHLEACCSSKNPRLSPETTENPSISPEKKKLTQNWAHQTSQVVNTPRYLVVSVYRIPSTPPNLAKARINVPVEALGFPISGEVEGTQDATSVLHQQGWLGWGIFRGGTTGKANSFKKNNVVVQLALHLMRKSTPSTCRVSEFFLETKTIFIPHKHQ